MTKSLKCFLLLLFLILNVCFSQTLIGKVVGITDGDTIKFFTQDSLQLKVRLANIDCPERKQPFYAKAKQFTANAVFGKVVKVEIINTDRYGRFIAEVIYSDSLNLSRELVRHGYAWNFVRYSKDIELKTIEASARKQKIVLWKDEHPIPPWEWRENNKNRTKG